MDLSLGRKSSEGHVCCAEQLVLAQPASIQPDLQDKLGPSAQLALKRLVAAREGEHHDLRPVPSESYIARGNPNHQ